MHLFEQWKEKKVLHFGNTEVLIKIENNVKENIKPKNIKQTWKIR